MIEFSHATTSHKVLGHYLGLSFRDFVRCHMEHLLKSSHSVNEWLRGTRVQTRVPTGW